jgi:CBS domain-containing protein
MRVEVDMRSKVSTAMTRNIETISPAATLEQAGKKMREHNVGFLPVVDEGKLLGVVTDRDIVLLAVSYGMRPYMTRVSEVMTHNAVFCYEDQDIAEASLLMEKNLVHRLVVLDRNGDLAGIVSLSDLAARTHSEALSGHVLSKVVAA